MKRNVLVWVEAAIIAALSMALSWIPDFAGWFTPSWGAIVLVIFHYAAVDTRFGSRFAMGITPLCSR